MRKGMYIFVWLGRSAVQRKLTQHCMYINYMLRKKTLRLSSLSIWSWVSAHCAEIYTKHIDSLGRKIVFLKGI